jgi:hypothetical protein
VEETVTRECEGFNLYFDLLAGMYEADILVREIGFDLETRTRRHDDHELLGWRHDAAERMYGQLLHCAVDGRTQGLQRGALDCLGEILRVLAP